MMFGTEGPITRSEKLTIMLVIIMLKLFAIGLFYDKDRDPEVEETEADRTFEESLEDFGWQDFWIMIYSILIVIPVPIILKKFFDRKKLEQKMSIKDMHKAKK